MFQDPGGIPLEHNDQAQGSEAFGAYLKKLREGRRLSLDAVEELSSAFPEKVTKSHLSRIENGLALPSFPRLMAMSHIYGIPIASMAERYEIELRRDMAPIDIAGQTEVEILGAVDRLVHSGEVHEGLTTAWALYEHRGESSFGAPMRDATSFELRIRIISSMILGGKLETAKSLAEEALSAPGMTELQRLVLLQLFATASYRLRRFTVALLAADECRKGAATGIAPPRFEPDVQALTGNIQSALGRPDLAIPLYEQAIEGYKQIENAYEASSATINLSEALADTDRLALARETIARTVQSLEVGTYARLRALAYCVWAKIELRDGKLDAADARAVKSNLLARELEYAPLIFRNCFYLWKVAQAKGDVAAVRLNARTLKSYLGRIEADEPEVEEFRAALAREDS